MNHKKKDPSESTPPEEKIPPLAPENAEESQQGIEEAAYYIGMNRRNHAQAGDEASDWFEAEKAVQENLD